MLSVLSGLPNCVRDGVSLLGRQFGVGQRASDGVGVKHRIMLPRLHVAPRLTGRAPGDNTPTEAEGTIPARPQAVLWILRNPIRNEGCNEGNGGTRMA